MSDGPVGPVDPKGRTEPGYERHVFVCVNQRPAGNVRGCCHRLGGPEIRERFVKELRVRGLGARMRANNAGCLDFCEFGPTVVIYPDGVWYRIEDVERDVVEIVERHLIGGEVVERCLLRMGAGG